MERALRVLIADDEPLARALLKEFLSSHPDVEICGEFENGFDAARAALALKPDIVLLDIEMPKLNGFEALELMDPQPAVIFTTAYDQYAVKAFAVHAVDYLLKPFDKERFDEALKRAARTARSQDGPVVDAPAVAALARSPQKHLTRIAIKDGSQITILPSSRIDYIEAQDDYVRIVSGGKGHMKQQTLASLESALDPARFIRVHRSYIINVEKLTRLEPGTAILICGTEIPVSRAGASRLREILSGRR
ncbi:MAG: LytTR family DNA-binding domain-containing protein [Thermoanaerobaculia bacterium]|nr:LytTR family DNA-binding domain-containing protein [Thermoanaerobaculia bacterium]